MHQRFRVVVQVGALGALVGGLLCGCSWEEKICNPGEVVVESAEGGRWCEQPKPGDRQCPEGEILRRIEASGREDCIPNVVDDDRERPASTTSS